MSEQTLEQARVTITSTGNEVTLELTPTHVRKG